MANDLDHRCVITTVGRTANASATWRILRIAPEPSDTGRYAAWTELMSSGSRAIMRKRPRKAEEACGTDYFHM
jgi:hypothetical protein